MILTFILLVLYSPNEPVPTFSRLFYHQEAFLNVDPCGSGSETLHCKYFFGLFASLLTGTYIKFSLQPRVEGAAQKTPSTCGNQEVMLAGRLTHHSQ